jgi:preprotein translocase subunit YajC
MLFTSFAYAMGQPGGGTGGGDAAGLASFVPLILMFAVFYFLLIRPQQKRTKEHKSMLDALKRGDDVVAGGGIYGRIVECADEYVILDVGDARLKMARASVSALVQRGKGETSAKGETPVKGKKDSGKSWFGRSGADKKGRNGEPKAIAASGDNADAADAPGADAPDAVASAVKTVEAVASAAKTAEAAASADKSAGTAASADKSAEAVVPADK